MSLGRSWPGRLHRVVGQPGIESAQSSLLADGRPNLNRWSHAGASVRTFKLIDCAHNELDCSRQCVAAEVEPHPCCPIQIRQRGGIPKG